MEQRHRICGLVAGILLGVGVVVTAGQQSTLARRADLLAARVDLGGGAAPMLATAAVRVVGFAWKGDDTPVEYPMLRIRNLQDGLVAARTTGSALGEFRFDQLSGGSYLLELVDSKGGLLAVGQPLVLLPGETVGTFIRLSDSAVANEAQLFGGSAPALVQTAAAADVTAIGGGFPASNER